VAHRADGAAGHGTHRGRGLRHYHGRGLQPRADEVPPPDGFEDGPTDDPDDDNVELPEDIALPWPDIDKIRAWWQQNGARFAPGVRLFMGQPVSPDSCTGVLREGFQRQRVAAALHLALLDARAPLFATSAPAWRQQRWLGDGIPL